MTVDVGAGSVPWRALSYASFPAAIAFVRSPRWDWSSSFTPRSRVPASSASLRPFSPSWRRVCSPLCGASRRATPAPRAAPSRNATKVSEFWSLIVVSSGGRGGVPKGAPPGEGVDQGRGAGLDAPDDRGDAGHGVDDFVDDHRSGAREAVAGVGELPGDSIDALRHVAERVEQVARL